MNESVKRALYLRKRIFQEHGQFDGMAKEAYIFEKELYNSPARFGSRWFGGNFDGTANEP